MGRPTKLTPETTKKLIDAIKLGNFFETACVYAGVDYATYRRWMQRGEKEKSGPFREFYEAVKKAEAEAEARVVAMWQKQIPDNWQAGRDFLERRYPDRWGRKEKIQQEVTGKDGGAIQSEIKVSIYLPDNGRGDGE